MKLWAHRGVGMAFGVALQVVMGSKVTRLKAGQEEFEAAARIPRSFLHTWGWCTRRIAGQGTAGRCTWVLRLEA